MLCLLLLSLSVNSFAIILIKDAEITMVANTASNEDKFVINTTGGSGVCDQAIVFPADATSPAIYERAFAIALTAFSTGQKVTINTYEDEAENVCLRATYIKLVK